MNEERLNAVLRGLDPEVAAEEREFATRDQWEQNLYLYRTVKSIRADVKVLQQRRSFHDRLYDYGMAGAMLAYLLFDNRSNLPGIK